MKSTLGEFLTRSLRTRPVFVVGSGRTGTTVMLNALGQHPRVRSAAGHAPLIALIGRFVCEVGPRHPNWDTARVSAETLYDSLADLGFRIAFGDSYGSNWIVKELRAMGPLALRKTHWAARPYPDEEQYQGICMLYPAAHFVYMIRNGVDVVHSRTRYSAFREDDFEQQCFVWADHAARYAYLQHAANAITVRQEELRAEPKGVMRDVLAAVGLPPDPRPANYLASTLVHPLDSPTQSGADVRAEFDSRPPAYQSWSAAQRDIFTRVCGQGMQTLGYEIPF
jgi:hypothetical protein